jgi:hypothetical protein
MMTALALDRRLRMTPWQQTAIAHHCRLAVETTHPRFAHWLDPGRRISLVLTVNSGYE